MNPVPSETMASGPASKYLEFEKVPEILAQLRSKEYPVSDIRCKDPENPDRHLYFVDLVQEGGGVLGMALAGYTYALEEAGIRFVNLAGTSAGAINTLLLAACGNPVDRKSTKILKLISAKKFTDFVDSGWRVLWPLKGVMHKNILLKIFSGFSLIVLNFWAIVGRKGLCSGDAFENWIKDILNTEGVSSVESLKNRMSTIPEGLEKRLPNGSYESTEFKARIAIIAADITTQTKVEFPLLANLYDAELTPERIVRASMSIPLFFRPKEFYPPKKEKEKARDWVKQVGYRGAIPDRVYMVDGGVMSNFPIDVFHEKNRTPKRPTFGIRLGSTRTKSSNINGIPSLIGASFDGARQLRDFEFLFNNEDYKNLVQYIDTDKYDWLDFSISEQKKMELFQLGVMAARDFLDGAEGKKGFDWAYYRALRRRMLFSSSTDQMESLWTKEDAIIKLGLNNQKDITVVKADFNIDTTKKVAPKGPVAPAASGLLGGAMATLADASPVIPEMPITAFQKNLDTITDYLDKRNRIKVLWIDEDPANDSFELSILRAFGLEYSTALTNDEALEMLTQKNNNFKLIIADSNRRGNLSDSLNFCKKLAHMDAPITTPILLHSTMISAVGYKGKSDMENELAILQRDYSPHIVGDVVDTRELIFAAVREISQVIAAE